MKLVYNTKRPVPREYFAPKAMGTAPDSSPEQFFVEKQWGLCYSKERNALPGLPPSEGDAAFQGGAPMTKILFVCHGNICRSPMAEFVMRDLVDKAGLSDRFFIASAATSTEEIGSPVYPPARRKLAEHGISCAGKTARQLRRRDYEEYDLLIGMDAANLRNMRRICGDDDAGKLHLLLDFTAHPGDVDDPWYTGDFDATWRDVEAGCKGLLRALTEP